MNRVPAIGQRPTLVAAGCCLLGALAVTPAAAIANPTTAQAPAGKHIEWTKK